MFQRNIKNKRLSSQPIGTLKNETVLHGEVLFRKKRTVFVRVDLEGLTLRVYGKDILVKNYFRKKVTFLFLKKIAQSLQVVPDFDGIVSRLLFFKPRTILKVYLFALTLYKFFKRVWCAIEKYLKTKMMNAISHASY